MTGLGLGDFVLRIMNLGGVDLDATLTAAAARGEVAILSRPVVLATNNETAEILVGSQRPFIQVQRTLPTDDAVRDQIVQYKDVGTRLIVKPTISADGYVTLEVTQEVNSATAETQFDAPIISTRTVSTRLLIKDGQTIVLGGLTDRQRDRNQGGVPVLSSIPLLGGLFGRSSRRATETELFLFLTPRVIRERRGCKANYRAAQHESPGGEAVSASIIDSQLLGGSQVMQRLRALIARVAPSDIPVLVTGETGVGKELVARAVHQLSGRAGRFVAANVCAVSENLFERALFGHVRGAYTGAVDSMPGLVGCAHTGTLFLDEIGNLRHVAQPSLLRVLETREYSRVGEEHITRASDFRLVSATNACLRSSPRTDSA